MALQTCKFNTKNDRSKVKTFTGTFVSNFCVMHTVDIVSECDATFTLQAYYVIK